MLSEPDKRRSHRVPWVFETMGSVLPSLTISEKVPTSVKGITQNISQGGVALHCEALLPTNAIVRCEFLLPGSPLAIPTLLQVRWSDQVKTDGFYTLGLKFLL